MVASSVLASPTPSNFVRDARSPCMAAVSAAITSRRAGSSVDVRRVRFTHGVRDPPDDFPSDGGIRIKGAATP